MKIMVASDIHGSALYCSLLLDAYKREKETGTARLLLLGDLLYHGPRNDLPEGYAPKEVISLLNGVREELICVRGNCDTEVDQMVLNFPILSDSALLLLGDRTIFATHGHRYNLQNLPPMKKGDVLLHGHTHVPAAEARDGILYLNPGSVSIPKEGSERGYFLLDEKRVVRKSLNGKILLDSDWESLMKEE